MTPERGPLEDADAVRGVDVVAEPAPRDLLLDLAREDGSGRIAFTLRGAQRKADRIRRRLEADRARQDAAFRIDNGTGILPDLRTTERG